MKKGMSLTPFTCATGLLTAQIVKASNGERLYRVMYYDDKGRVTDVRETFLNKIVSKTTTNYSFTNHPVKSVTNVTVNNGYFHVITDSMVYDSKSDLLVKDFPKIRR